MYLLHLPPNAGVSSAYAGERFVSSSAKPVSLRKSCVDVYTAIFQFLHDLLMQLGRHRVDHG